MSFLGAPLGTLLGGVPQGIVGSIRVVDILRLELGVRQRRVIPQIDVREIEIVPQRRRQKLT